MKYGYKGVESKELIKNYKTFKDKIIITFLDGTKYEIPLTEENEKDLLNKMIVQAQKRNESSALSDTKEQKDILRNRILLQTFLTIFNFVNASLIDSKNIKSLVGILGGLVALTIVLDGIEYKVKSDKINELEKYSIYLSIRERLEKINDPNLFSGIKRKRMTLDINTLDNFSLDDIIKIGDNLERCEENSAYSNKSKHNLVLTKKS